MDVFSNQEQLRLLLQSVLLGVGVGLLYDVLRALRWQFACGRGATAVLDLVFWLVLTAGLFEFGLVFAAGQPRFFVLAGAAGGMTLYFLLLSSAVLLILAAILRAGVRVWAAGTKVAQCAQNVWCRVGISNKVRQLAKKIQISSSIFRRKGIK